MIWNIHERESLTRKMWMLKSSIYDRIRECRSGSSVISWRKFCNILNSQYIDGEKWCKLVKLSRKLNQIFVSIIDIRLIILHSYFYSIYNKKKTLWQLKIPTKFHSTGLTIRFSSWFKHSMSFPVWLFPHRIYIELTEFSDIRSNTGK